jgi:hypothetical protein
LYGIYSRTPPPVPPPVPPFVHLFHLPFIAAAENRAKAGKANVVAPIISFLQSSNLDLQRNSAGALANLASESGAPLR